MKRFGALDHLCARNRDTFVFSPNKYDRPYEIVFCMNKSLVFVIGIFIKVRNDPLFQRQLFHVRKGVLFFVKTRFLI